MKKQAAIIILISLVLTACNQNKPTAEKIPEVGEAIDSSAIAQDTLNQKSLESSYEYAQTVIVNPKLVYDVRAYGGPPSHGEYCIIRRGADNKPDTVVQGVRDGIIVNSFTADLNGNGKEEIYVVMRTPSRFTPSYVAAFEFNKNGTHTPLISPWANSPNICDSIYPTDTIFVIHDLLMKKYPRRKYEPAKSDIYHAWRLDGEKFKLVHYD